MDNSMQNGCRNSLKRYHESAKMGSPAPSSTRPARFWDALVYWESLAWKAIREKTRLVAGYEKELEVLRRENESLKCRNQYVCVLIDGNHMTFQQRLINQGKNGGKQAAKALRTAFDNLCIGDDVEFKIFITIFANFSSLGSSTVAGDFRRGFTEAEPGFEFIDIDCNTGVIASKVEELTKWHLGNYNCMRVLLGMSHDVGFAPFLRMILKDKNARKRVGIIEDTTTVLEIKATHIELIKLGVDIFGGDKLVEQVQETESPAPRCYATAAQLMNPIPGENVVLQLRNPERQEDSSHWFMKLRKRDKAIALNPDVQQKMRKEGTLNDLCANHYIRGHCAKKYCPRDHRVLLTDEQRKVLEAKTLLTPCDYGQYCNNPHCIFGHHCQSWKDGWCRRQNCKYSAYAHPPGTKYLG